LPAITLPTSSMSNKDNMPIGMELATITGYDRKLMAVARSLEKIILGHEQR
jgi:Asp-tRNA(Asn)/Glu-tRNA(Gln) amidotransferase A subunit family amidase